MGWFSLQKIRRTANRHAIALDTTENSQRVQRMAPEPYGFRDLLSFTVVQRVRSRHDRATDTFCPMDGLITTKGGTAFAAASWDSSNWDTRRERTQAQSMLG